MQGAHRLKQEERDQQRLKKLAFKDKYEYRERGKYQRLFPLPDEDVEASVEAQQLQHHYDFLIACSKEIYGEQTSLGAVNAKKKIEELDKKWNGP